MKLRFQGLVLKSCPDWTTDAVARCSSPDANVLLFAHSPFTSVVVERTQTLGVVKSGHGYPPTNFVLGARPLDERAWIDAFEVLLERRCASGISPVELQPFALPSALWERADHQVALLWLALRRIEPSACVRRADGAILARVSSGLGVELLATRSREPLDAAVIIECGTEHQMSPIQQLPTGISAITASVRRTVVVHVEQVRLQVSLVGSPLFGSGSAAALADSDADEPHDDD